MITHAQSNAIIASKSQAKSCDIRFCDISGDARQWGMDIEWLKAEMARKGLKQVELARALDMDATKVSKMLRGGRNLKLAEATKAREFLASLDGPIATDPGAPKASEIVFVRKVDISYAMGDGSVIEDYPEISFVPYSLDFIRQVTRSNTASLFIATGQGDSMEPTLLRSDQLMIDGSQRHIGQQDQIWAISYAGVGMVKRIRRTRSGDRDQIVILSDNEHVPPHVVDAEDVHVVGKVVWVGRVM